MQISWLGALVALLIAGVFILIKKSPPPAFVVPKLGREEKSRRALLPKLLKISGLVFFLLALTDPHTSKVVTFSENSPTEARALMLALDVSGSMRQIDSLDTSRLDALKGVVQEFIQKRPNDLIGMLSFARKGWVQSPPTFDHEALIDKLQALTPVSKPTDDGTAIGYAIYKGANLLNETARARLSSGTPLKSMAEIIVTDGVQAPNPLDNKDLLKNISILEAAKRAKAQGVRLYIFAIEPKIGEETFSKMRDEMDQAARLTGGKLYVRDGGNPLPDFLQDIDSLEKSAFQVIESRTKRLFSLYPYLIACGLFLLFSAVFLEVSFVRGVP